MTALKIGTLDVSSWLTQGGLTVEYQVLLSDKSGRNARGTNRVEIVARKDKVIAQFRALSAGEIKQFLQAIEPYVFDVTYLSPKTGQEKTIQIYHGSLQIGYTTIDSTDFAKSMMQEFELSFIEM